MTVQTTNRRLSGYLNYGTHVELYVTDCATCGVLFAITTDYEKRRRNDAKGFYCPNGHGHSWHESEADRLRARAEEAERSVSYWREEYATEKRQHNSTKGTVTKLRKRAEAGMCSSCNRTFKNYAKHMRDKHGVANGGLETA